MNLTNELSKGIQSLRNIQLKINESIIKGIFPVPVHLGLGHEAVAVAVVAALESTDQILLTHRNIHFQIALGATQQELEDEYLLKSSGLAEGKLGSMNLMNPEKGNTYTSNILGNNLAVALGLGLGAKVSVTGGVIWVITGDGAIEEGIFYESLLIASSLELPIVYVIENNGWSLATTIEERRVQLDLAQLTKSLSVSYSRLQDNNPHEYLKHLQTVRENVANQMTPHVLEIFVHSLGGFIMDEGKESQRYINYHAGAVRVEPDNNGVFEQNSMDPLYVVLEDLKTK
jgi:TPP-dependent pyruvate/acetoin dehydrogenase alpha subunit